MSDKDRTSDPAGRPHPNAEFGGEGNNRLRNRPGEEPKPRTDEEIKRAKEEEHLQTAVEDSFPASDPPAITQPVHKQGEPGGSKPG